MCPAPTSRKVRRSLLVGSNMLKWRTQRTLTRFTGYGYDHLEAIRVYYGDTAGYVQELGT